VRIGCNGGLLLHFQPSLQGYLLEVGTMMKKDTELFERSDAT